MEAELEVECMAGQKPGGDTHGYCTEKKCRTCGHNYAVCLARAITYTVDGMTVGEDGLARLIVPRSKD